MRIVFVGLVFVFRERGVRNNLRGVARVQMYLEGVKRVNSPGRAVNRAEGNGILRLNNEKCLEK